MEPQRTETWTWVGSMTMRLSWCVSEGSLGNALSSQYPPATGSLHRRWRKPFKILTLPGWTSLSPQYLLNDKEVKIKTDLWMLQNSDYLKEQKGTFPSVVWHFISCPTNCLPTGATLPFWLSEKAERIAKEKELGIFKEKKVNLVSVLEHPSRKTGRALFWLGASLSTWREYSLVLHQNFGRAEALCWGLTSVHCF